MGVKARCYMGDIVIADFVNSYYIVYIMIMMIIWDWSTEGFYQGIKVVMDIWILILLIFEYLVIIMRQS